MGVPEIMPSSPSVKPAGKIAPGNFVFNGVVSLARGGEHVGLNLCHKLGAYLCGIERVALFVHIQRRSNRYGVLGGLFNIAVDEIVYRERIGAAWLVVPVISPVAPLNSKPAGRLPFTVYSTNEPEVS